MDSDYSDSFASMSLPIDSESKPAAKDKESMPNSDYSEDFISEESLDPSLVQASPDKAPSQEVKDTKKTSKSEQPIFSINQHEKTYPKEDSWAHDIDRPIVKPKYQLNANEYRSIGDQYSQELKPATSSFEKSDIHTKYQSEHDLKDQKIINVQANIEFKQDKVIKKEYKASEIGNRNFEKPIFNVMNKPPIDRKLPDKNSYSYTKDSPIPTLGENSYIKNEDILNKNIYKTRESLNNESSEIKNPTINAHQRRFKSVPSKPQRVIPPFRDSRNAKLPSLSSRNHSLVPMNGKEDPKMYAQRLEAENFNLRDKLKKLNSQLTTMLSRLSTTPTPNQQDMTMPNLYNMQRLAQLEESEHVKLKSVYSKIDSDMYPSLNRQVNTLKERLKKAEKLNQQLNYKLRLKKEKIHATDRLEPSKVRDLTNERNSLLDRVDKLEVISHKHSESFKQYVDKEEQLQEYYEKFVKTAMNRNNDLAKRTRARRKAKKINSNYDKKLKEFNIRTKCADNNIRNLEKEEAKLLKVLEAVNTEGLESCKAYRRVKMSLQDMKVELSNLKYRIEGTEMEYLLEGVKFESSEEEDLPSFSQFKNPSRLFDIEKARQETGDKNLSIYENDELEQDTENEEDIDLNNVYIESKDNQKIEQHILHQETPEEKLKIEHNQVINISSQDMEISEDVSSVENTNLNNRNYYENDKYPEENASKSHHSQESLASPENQLENLSGEEKAVKISEAKNEEEKIENSELKIEEKMIENVEENSELQKEDDRIGIIEDITESKEEEIKIEEKKNEDKLESKEEEEMIQDNLEIKEDIKEISEHKNKEEMLEDLKDDDLQNKQARKEEETDKKDKEIEHISDSEVESNSSKSNKIDNEIKSNSSISGKIDENLDDSDEKDEIESAKSSSQEDQKNQHELEDRKSDKEYEKSMEIPNKDDSEKEEVVSEKSKEEQNERIDTPDEQERNNLDRIEEIKIDEFDEDNKIADSQLENNGTLKEAIDNSSISDLSPLTSPFAVNESKNSPRFDESEIN